MKRRYSLARSVLLIAAVSVAGCSGTQPSVVFERFTVAFDGRSWIAVYEDKQSKDTIVQYVPDSSTIMNWKEMITERTFPGLQLTSDPEQESDDVHKLAQEKCKKVDWRIAAQTTDSITYVAGFAGCTEPRAPHEVGRFLISSKAIYLVQYQSKKASLTADETQAWVDLLARAHYDDIVE